MNKLATYFPAIAVAAAALFLLAATIPPADAAKEIHFHEFGQLPVHDGGRFKPIDYFARINLMLISGKQTFKDTNGVTQPATKWLLDVMVSRLGDTDPAPAMEHKVFRIENEELLALLGLEPRPGLRYSLLEFRDRLEGFDKEIKRVEKLDPAQLNNFDKKVIELYRHLETFKDIATWKAPLTMPPRNGKAEDWKPFIVVLMEQRDGVPAPPAADTFREMLTAYAKNDSDVFNAKLDVLQKQVNKNLTSEASATGFEAFFNDFDPFYRCAWLYGVIFLLSVFAWIGWRLPLTQAAFLLALMVLTVHTFALLARMYIQGRPPVTNLYSSAVFIGWGAVGLCLGIEHLFRNGIGTLVASILGGLTMIIALHLAESGDTMEMLVAVLDTNFWLATHVTCVTLGYTATFVAGTIATVYLLLGIFTRVIDKPTSKMFAQIIYGVVAFATLLSFTGTVLGGIWADQSWGRFWGWDPKENGALLIVIWNALILHARWGGMVKDRGIAVLAVVGNMITAWSWFGTNQLSVGLHNYGFNTTLAIGCRYYWMSQLAIIGLGLLPPRLWRSNRPTGPKPTLPPAAFQPWKGGDKSEMVTSS